MGKGPGISRPSTTYYRLDLACPTESFPPPTGYRRPRWKLRLGGAGPLARARRASKGQNQDWADPLPSVCGLPKAPRWPPGGRGCPRSPLPSCAHGERAWPDSRPRALGQRVKDEGSRTAVWCRAGALAEHSWTGGLLAPTCRPPRDGPKGSGSHSKRKGLSLAGSQASRCQGRRGRRLRDGKVPRVFPNGWHGPRPPAPQQDAETAPVLTL